MSNKTPEPFRRRGSWVYVVGVSLVLVAMVLLGTLYARQKSSIRQEANTRATALQAGPSVKVVNVVRGPQIHNVTYMGEVHPYAEVTLYAKVSGYLKQIYVDKGDRVRAGQTLAVIESPELDQKYEGDRADYEYKAMDAKRYRQLADKGVMAQQEAQTRETLAQVAKAILDADQTMKDYENLRAPFSGTVTARFADPGALLQAATGAQTGALPVITLSDMNRVRVYIYVDQNTAQDVHVGDVAKMNDATRLDIQVPARVTRITHELDARTRTLLVELDLDNTAGKLIAGSFVQVTLNVGARSYPQIPAEAIITRNEKQFVAVLAPGNMVSLRQVQVASVDGKNAQIASGLGEGDQVIVNLGNDAKDGDKVQPEEATAS